MKKIILLIVFLVNFLACKENLPQKTTADLIEQNTPQKIASAHGLEEWKKVTQIKFTFNADRGENHFERSWIWKPKTNDITLITAENTLKYNQNSMDSIALNADINFINDKYWLLAPFNLAWDKGFTFAEKSSIKAPISKKLLQQLTITYGNEGGYTPGDAYDFYYNKNLQIEEWIFRKGNDSLPTMVTSWEDYKDYGGIKIATKHQNPEGTFALYFTNIEVEKEE
ncbi:MAG: hypothetical protein CVU03_13055 [Bacteroidetes bacterium HGW-Bacteroidetes-2]|jgi:hypothetical protein|nr:MAG: hypothetical protein CVU03_13055 [Bacteroidetes bacterium HGW-Bacteroidetes-2]